MAYVARPTRVRTSGPSYSSSTLSLLVIAACSAGEPTSVADAPTSVADAPSTSGLDPTTSGPDFATITASSAHQPSGYTKIFNTPFTAGLSNYKNGEGWYIQWGYSRFLANTSILSLGATPESPSNGMKVRYETSLSGGTSPTLVFYGGPVPANHGYLYQRVQLKIDPSWTDNGNSGSKWGFFKTKGYINNHGWGVTYYSTHKVRVFSQFNDLQSANREWVMANSMQKGVWHTVELLIEPGTPGQFNGTLRGWVDGNAITWTRKGVYKTVVTDMMWFKSGQTPHFDNIYYDGTYGGGANHPPYTMYVWCDHWYASTK